MKSNEIIKSLSVIYEDNHIIVVVKPAGIPSQADKTGDVDMLTVVKEYIKEKYNKPGEVFLGLVHRLDRMTSGLMVFAKTSKAASRISKNIREGDFKKGYLAVVNGKLEKGKTGILENYLKKCERTNTSKVVSEKENGSKLAKLEYEVIGNTEYRNKEYSYVRIKLYTGRHHQIRVQFANINHPLYGDVKYGSGKGDLGLFASYLKLIHPTKDEILDFNELPQTNGIWEELNKWI